jgi:hypothetical protein
MSIFSYEDGWLMRHKSIGPRFSIHIFVVKPGEVVVQPSINDFKEGMAVPVQDNRIHLS